MATDEECRQAGLLGRGAARAGRSVTICPYPIEQRVLRHRWVAAFTAADGGLAATVARRVRRTVARIVNEAHAAAGAP